MGGIGGASSAVRHMDKEYLLRHYNKLGERAVLNATSFFPVCGKFTYPLIQ